MTKIITIITLILLLNGCSKFSIFKSEVQQGNALDSKLVSKLEKGMSKDEVTALLGTPLLQDNFRPNRWDYIFFDGNGSQLKNKQNITLFFESDQLTQIKK